LLARELQAFAECRPLKARKSAAEVSAGIGV
jgi:hypothetical protein